MSLGGESSLRALVLGRNLPLAMSLKFLSFIVVSQTKSQTSLGHRNARLQVACCRMCGFGRIRAKVLQECNSPFCRWVSSSSELKMNLMKWKAPCNEEAFSPTASVMKWHEQNHRTHKPSPPFPVEIIRTAVPSLTMDSREVVPD